MELQYFTLFPVLEFSVINLKIEMKLLVGLNVCTDHGHLRMKQIQTGN
jgi:hypothetical protein